MTENTQPKINLADLESAVSIIDYAVSKGIITSWDDFQNVYQIRQRLHAFVTASKPLIQEGTNQEQTDKSE